jgi:hypothetical protein
MREVPEAVEGREGCHQDGIIGLTHTAGRLALEVLIT